MLILLKLLEKSVIGKNINEINKYFNNKSYFENSNGSIKVRDCSDDEIVFIISYDLNKIVTSIL